MKLYYKGAEITDICKPTACMMHDVAGDWADYLCVVLSDTAGLWPSWGPERGDTMRYVNDDFDSGTLYVDEARLLPGAFRVEAVSIAPAARVERSRIWRQVKLSEIMGDIAKRCGLSVKSYNLTDYTYQSLSQCNEGDIPFLSRICQREGYAVKISGDCLIVYNEKQLESAAPSLTIQKKDVQPGHSFGRGTGLLSSFTVSYFNIATGKFYTRTVRDESIIGGSEQRIELCSSDGEAERFATGYLRAANKGAKIASLNLLHKMAVAAGSTVKIDDEFGSGKSGAWFVECVEQDAISGLTTIHLRAPLGY